MIAFKSWRSRRSAPPRRTPSALARFEAGIGFVDNVNTSFTANKAVFAVACFQRFQRVLDLHWSRPFIICRAGVPAPFLIHIVCIQTKTRQWRAELLRLLVAPCEIVKFSEVSSKAFCDCGNFADALSQFLSLPSQVKP
jgi:hypothetical protein